MPRKIVTKPDMQGFGLSKQYKVQQSGMIGIPREALAKLKMLPGVSMVNITIDEANNRLIIEKANK